MKYFAKIKYLGTNFHGFQVQPGLRTVQSELSLALLEVFGETPRVTGCSRTDAGVHANEFCVKIESERATVPPHKLPIAVARFLPPDLSLFYAEECSSDFHPRYDVKYKEYVYRIWNRPERNPFAPNLCFHYPHVIDNETLEKMNMAAKQFCGKHDFITYMSKGGKDIETVRTVMYASVERQGDFIEFKVAADGFLYNMVRIMAGTLIAVAEGKTAPEDIMEITLSKDRKRAGATAPACGLFLNKVVY